MSMLSSQADELRLMARLVRDYDYKEISRVLREAADTIESLRDRLQELQGVGGESNYTRLFGTPEQTARTLCDVVSCVEAANDCDACEFSGLCVRTGDYDALLEWLRGDAE